MTGLKISTHLRVVTKLEVPFIYAETVDSADQCEVELKKIPCPMPNKTGVYICVHKYNRTASLDQQNSETLPLIKFVISGHATMNCCYGYAIDLLVELSKTVNFTYDLHLSEEEAYGSFERVRYVYLPLLPVK